MHLVCLPKNAFSGLKLILVFRLEIRNWKTEILVPVSKVEIGFLVWQLAPRALHKVFRTGWMDGHFVHLKPPRINVTHLSIFPASWTDFIHHRVFFLWKCDSKWKLAEIVAQIHLNKACKRSIQGRQIHVNWKNFLLRTMIRCWQIWAHSFSVCWTNEDLV